MAIIDTSGRVPSNTSNVQEQNTKVIQEVKIIEHQAPKELTLLYSNLNELLDLAQNYQDILEVAQRLEQNLKSLSNIDMEAIKQLPISEILEVASKTNDISRLSLIRDDIEKISKLDRELITMNAILNEIQEVSEISKDIVKISNMSDVINVVSNYEKELVRIFESLDELLLVEQELSYVIQLAKLLSGYKKFLTDNSLTDTEYANFIKNIQQNINEIKTLSNSIEEIKKLNEKINQTPDILQEYHDKLDLLVLEAKTRFEQLLVDGIDRLEEATQKGEKELIDLAHQLKVLIGNCGGTGGGTGGIIDLSNYAEIVYVNTKDTELNNKINTKYEELSNKITQLETKDSELANKNTEQDAKDVELETLINNKFTELNNKYNALDGKSTQLETKDTELENKYNELDAKIDQAKQEITTTLDDYATKEYVDNKTGDTSTLETTAKNLTNAINELKTRVDAGGGGTAPDLTDYAKKNADNSFTVKQTFTLGGTTIDPVNDNDIANKKYVNDKFSSVDLINCAKKNEENTFNEDQTFVKNLIVATEPTDNNHLTNKKYVDDSISNLKIHKLKVLDDVIFVESDIKDKGAYKHEITIESNKYISILDVYIEDSNNQCIVSVPYDVIVKDNKSIIFLDIQNVKKITYLEIDI